MAAAVLGLLGALLLSILANDLWTMASGIAHRIVTAAARLWCANPDHAETLAEEWRAYINDRPGQLLKLATALGLYASAVVRAIARAPKTQGTDRQRPERTAPRIHMPIRIPAWMPSIDRKAGENEAVPTWLTIGTGAALIPFVLYFTETPINWIYVAWTLAATVASTTITASVTLGFLVREPWRIAANTQSLPPHIQASNPHAAPAPELDATTSLVRPFVQQTWNSQPTNTSSPTDLIRPYVTKPSSSTHKSANANTPSL